MASAPKLDGKEVMKWSTDRIAVAMATAVGWNPEEGEELSGIVLGVRAAVNKLNDTRYPIVFVVVNTDDPENKEGYDVIGVHCFHTILLSEMLSHQPILGDFIYLKNLGPKPGWVGTPGMNPPIVWAVNVTKPSGRQKNIWESFTTPAPTSGQQFTPDEPNF